MASPVTYTNLSCKSALNAVKSPAMPFDWSINPYRGCRHGCSFCYARKTHAFLGIEGNDAFQTRIFVKTNAAERLRSELARRAGTRNGLKSLGTVAIGTATDPYQPAEAKARITRGCLEALAEYGLPVTITTRSPLILRDLDLLKGMDVVSVNISLNTLDLKVWRRFEPFSPSPVKRLSALARLRSEGINAGVFLAPILPWITDGIENLRGVVREAAGHGATFVMHEVLKLDAPEVKHAFFRTLNAHYPALAPRYGEWYARGDSPPAVYRRRIGAAVEELLREFRLASAEPLRSAAAIPPPAPPAEAPEQLCLPI